LDEIHTIGQQEGGAVWEQILLLAPCPIMSGLFVSQFHMILMLSFCSGLSATIGEPEVFNEWLGSVQTAHDYKHNFIHHPHRYSHLRKFYYLLQDGKPTPEKFTGLKKYKSTERMKFIHPIAMLSFGARSMPPDLSLEAGDTLLLYEALKSCPGAISSGDLERLEPARFFTSGRLLRQEDILRYESALKEVVARLMSSLDQNDPSSPLKLVTEKLTDPSIRKLTDVELNALPENRRFRSQLINLVSDLHAQGDLARLIHPYVLNSY
jgi:ATP-dependent RNA helicase DDX60